jgi:formylglycine-generating enzyme required for sulfatase activity
LNSIREFGQMVKQNNPDSLLKGEDDFSTYEMDSLGVCLRYKAKDTIGTADTIYLNLLSEKDENILIKYAPSIIPENDSLTDIDEPEIQEPEIPAKYLKKTITYTESYARLIPKSLTRAEEFLQDYFWWLLAAAIALGLLVLGWLLKILFHKEKRTEESDPTLVAQLETKNLPPYVWNIELEGNGDVALDDDIAITLRQLRERAKDEAIRLDITKTISNTIKQGGRFTPDYRAVTRPPEYLMLIEKRSPGDHRAMFYNTLYETFSTNDIHVERYFFKSDIRVCYNEEFKLGIKLIDLVKKHSDSRLIIMGNGSYLMNPMSGKLAKWTSIFEEWKERAIMTPKTLDTWNRQENRLEELFTVMPSSHKALGYWADVLKNDLDWDKKRWKSHLPTAQTQAVTLGNDIAATLKKHYKESLQIWIAACAVYPSLHWDLTIHLGHFISNKLDDKNLVSSSNLADMFRLKWFADGQIPNAARADLIAFLQNNHPELLEDIRQNLNEVLENNQPPVYSAAYDEHRMNIALNQWMLEDDDKKKKELQKEIEKYLHHGIEADFVMIKQISEKQRTALHFEVPNQWNKYITDNENLEGEGKETDEPEKKTDWKKWMKVAGLITFLLIHTFMTWKGYQHYLGLENDCQICLNEKPLPSLTPINPSDPYLASIYPDGYFVNGRCKQLDKVLFYDLDNFDSLQLCIKNSQDYLLYTNHKALNEIYAQSDRDTSTLDYLNNLDRFNPLDTLTNFGSDTVDHATKVYKNIAIAYYNKAVDAYDLYEKSKSYFNQIQQDQQNQQQAPNLPIEDNLLMLDACELIQKAYRYDSLDQDIRSIMRECGNEMNDNVKMLKGLVLDVNKRPIPNAKIVWNNGQTTTTNKEGVYEIIINNGIGDAKISKAWYKTLTVSYSEYQDNSMGDIALQSLIFKAKVVDEEGEPLSGVELLNGKLKINTKTDTNGDFSIEGKPSFTKTALELSVFYDEGYEKTSFWIDSDLDKNPSKFVLEYNGGGLVPYPVASASLISILTEKDGKMGLGNEEGKQRAILVPIEYDNIEEYKTEQNNLYFILQKDNLYYLFVKGLMDKPQGPFNFIAPHKNGLFRIQKGNKFTYMTFDGENAMNKTFDQAEDFDADGTAQVTEGRRTIRINTEGECVKNCDAPIKDEYLDLIDLGNKLYKERKFKDALATFIKAQKIKKTTEVNRLIQKSRASVLEAIKNLKPKMVYVNGGSFMMGCKEEKGNPCRKDEFPQHQVILSNYYIGKNEVTFNEYDRFCNDTGREKPNDNGWGRGLRPVINVNWKDATAYCKWLSEKTDKFYSLPTEAQWEYAARGGNKSNGYQYAGSDDLDPIGWYNGNSKRKTSVIKAKKPNELGIYDMTGNVSEWCNNFHAEYSNTQQQDPQGPSSGKKKVSRGGSWYSPKNECRITLRETPVPGQIYNALGFRIVELITK